MVLSEVANSDLEVEHAVSDGDQSVSAENYCGSSAGGLGELGKEDARHHGWDDDPGDALDAHGDDGEGTSSCGCSSSVPSHDIYI